MHSSLICEESKGARVRAREANEVFFRKKSHPNDKVYIILDLSAPSPSPITET